MEESKQVEGIKEKQKQKKLSSSSSTFSFESSSDDEDELRHMPLAPPRRNAVKRLSKQLSMCETPRDIAWERRRRQILMQQRSKLGLNAFDVVKLTDEDFNELKGSIELGFGFNEEDGQRLSHTLPALDLYFAVNRQLSPSPVSTPNSQKSESSCCSSSLGGRSSSFCGGSPRSESDWKICSPGDDPKQVKQKLRHWAQAVACSVLHQPK